MITHDKQQKIWDEEHHHPQVLKQMDSGEPSSGVVKFLGFLKENNLPHTTGLEMGCGKGRNVIWLAQQGLRVSGFDFSPYAIKEAKERGQRLGVSNDASFFVQDATKPWPQESNQFDFGIDCFASTDIESPEGRTFAIREMCRVLKPNGYLLAYLLSPDDEFHKKMIQKSPAMEHNAFIHKTGKFEKVFDEEDIARLYKDFEVIRKERVNKTTEFFGKEYNCLHFWLILKKPASR